MLVKVAVQRDHVRVLDGHVNAAVALAVARACNVSGALRESMIELMSMGYDSIQMIRKQRDSHKDES
jgi:hypothetical protein